MGHQNLAVHVQKVASYHKEMYTTKLVTSIWSFFTLADKNKSSANSFKGFLLKKHAPKSPDFEEFVFFLNAIVEPTLSPNLEENLWCGYITKLKKQSDD
jgi:hypothetical protein